MNVSWATSSASWRLPIIARLAAKMRSLCSCTIRSKRWSTPSITLSTTHSFAVELQTQLPTPAAPFGRGRSSPHVGEPVHWNHDAPPVVIGASDGGPTNGWRSVHARSAWGQGRLRRDRSALPGSRLSDGIRDHRLIGGRRGRRAGGFCEGVSGPDNVPNRSGTEALAAADRRQRGAQPRTFGGPPPPARASTGGALPPGGCGPIPRGGGRGRRGSEPAARPRQRLERGGPPSHREPLLPRAQR